MLKTAGEDNFYNKGLLYVPLKDCIVNVRVTVDWKNETSPKSDNLTEMDSFVPLTSILVGFKSMHSISLLCKYCSPLHACLM